MQGVLRNRVRIIVYALIFLPFIALAQTNIDAGANSMCNPFDPMCPCSMKFDPQKGCIPGPNMNMCPCQGQKTSGICDAPNHCKATAYKAESGQAGGAPGMDQLMQALKGLMDALKGGGGGGGGGGSGGGDPSGGMPYSGPESGAGCATYYSTPSPTSTDPCAYYIPNYSYGQNGEAGGSITLPNGVTVPTGCVTYTQTSVQNDPNQCSYYVPIGTGGDGSGGLGGNGGTTQCTFYSQTLNPSDSNPCTFYVPGYGAYGGAGGADGNGADGSSGGNGSSGSNGSSAGNGSNSAGGGISAGEDNAAADGSSADGSTSTGGSGSGTKNNKNISNTTISINGGGGGLFQQLLKGINSLTGGLRGDIDVNGNGVTVYGGNLDLDTNSGSAGFFGAGGGSQSMMANLCRTRPWAKSFFSAVLPASFFDRICELRGYQVGEPPPGLGGGTPKATGKKPTDTDKTTNLPNVPKVIIPPQADIWASPATVALGGRTSIFWNSRGVTACHVTSTAGHFEEGTLSGGASTVPILAATTFTINCTAQDGSLVTNSVVVTLRI